MTPALTSFLKRKLMIKSAMYSAVHIDTCQHHANLWHSFETLTTSSTSPRTPNRRIRIVHAL